MSRSRELERQIAQLVADSNQQRQRLLAITSFAQGRVHSLTDSVLRQISALAAVHRIGGILARILR